ncbi:hypothetical protein R4K48_10990 [Brachyspira pulli]|uniref:hypothetical protein n=1 Tax=Brachyspira pulli TaxID=310721 RepID=UPI003007D215
MDIFELICNSIDDFDDGFENVLQSLNEKIEGSENKSRRSVRKNNTAVRSRRRNTARRKNNNIENNNIVIDADDTKEIKYNIERLKENINKLKYKADLKFNEIKELIKDFDYASKKSYEESSIELQNNLKDELKKIDNINNDEDYKNYIESVNNIIAYINNLYKSAYYKKNNKSSLSFLIGDDEDIIDLIAYID